MAFKMRGFSGFKQTDGKKILAKYKEKKPGGRDPYEIPTDSLEFHFLKIELLVLVLILHKDHHDKNTL